MCPSTLLPFPCFVLLSLAVLGLPRPAQAQGAPGGVWMPQQCDAQGNPAGGGPDNNGYFTPQGTQSGSGTNSYPVPLTSAGVPTAATTYSPSPTVGNIGGIGHVEADNFTPDPNSAWLYSPAGPYTQAGSVYANGATSVSLSGQIDVYAKYVWRPYSSPTPTFAAPDHIDFLLSTNLQASAFVSRSASSYHDGQLSASATVSDGSPYNETASQQATDVATNVTGTPQVVGNHLVRASVGSGGVAHVSFSATTALAGTNTVPLGAWQNVQLSPTVSYMAPVPTNGQATATATGSATCSVRLDDREVTISCPTIEDSYYKAANPDPTHGDRYQHLRDPLTGAIVTDSVATWTTADYAAGGGWIASDTFTANTPGFQNPSYAWSGDFSGPGMVEVNLAQQSVNGNWFFGGSDKLPTKSTVRVDVTDSDGASAANTFGITWHLPYEAPNPVPYSVVPGKYQVQPARLGPVPENQTSLKKATEPKHIDWDAAIDGASVVAKVAGQEEIAGGLEIVGAIAKIAKPYTDVDAESSTETGATNNSDTWSGCQTGNNQEIYGGGNVPSSLANDPNGYLLCNMYIYQVVHYKDKYWNADGYNSHGYDGNSNHVVYLRNIDSVYDEFYYVQYKNRDGSPLN